MANVYDQQFKNRLTMHMLVCDRLSAQWLSDLCYFLEQARTRAEKYRGTLQRLKTVTSWGDADEIINAALAKSKNEG